MATTTEHEPPTLVGHARYCARCGHIVGDGLFCPGCGNPIESEAESGPHAPPPAAALTPPTREPKRRLGVVFIAAAGALGLVAIAVAAIILLTSSNSPSGSNQSVTVYHQKLTAALGPVLTADKNLSSALQAIDGSGPTLNAAGNAASQASSAITAAKGAVVVLTVPSSDTTLSQQLQQALSAETGYVQDVSSTLSNPTGQGAAQLQTLSTSAQTALIPLASLAPGIDSSVSGAGNLANWAQGAAGAAAAAKLRHQQPPSGSSSSGSSSGGSSSTNSGGGSTGTSEDLSVGRTCADGTYAGPHTSCAFAINVHHAWTNAPGAASTLQVYSPVTGQTYTMTCGPSGSGIVCTGGNNSYVSW